MESLEIFGNIYRKSNDARGQYARATQQSVLVNGTESPLISSAVKLFGDGCPRRVCNVAQQDWAQRHSIGMPVLMGKGR